jgi:hypothetical protein
VRRQQSVVLIYCKVSNVCYGYRDLAVTLLYLAVLYSSDACV